MPLKTGGSPIPTDGFTTLSRAFSIRSRPALPGWHSDSGKKIIRGFHFPDSAAHVRILQTCLRRPQLRIADVDYNVDRLIAGFREASEKQAAAVVFPELSITGYSCGDLFFQPRLRQAALEGLRRFTEATEKSGTVAIVGLPFLYGMPCTTRPPSCRPDAFWRWFPKRCCPTTGNLWKSGNLPPPGPWEPEHGK